MKGLGFISSTAMVPGPPKVPIVIAYMSSSLNSLKGVIKGIM